MLHESQVLGSETDSRKGIQDGKHPCRRRCENGSVLRHFNPVSLRRITIVWFLRGPVSSFMAAARLAPELMSTHSTRDLMTVDPWDDEGAEILWRHSPVRYADRIRTPTLFIHGDRDFRCCKEEALQMFTALRYHEVDSRLVFFRGEGHGLPVSGRPANRIRRLEEIFAWFAAHLKDR